MKRVEKSVSNNRKSKWTVMVDVLSLQMTVVTMATGKIPLMQTAPSRHIPEHTLTLGVGIERANASAGDEELQIEINWCRLRVQSSLSRCVVAQL